VAIGGVAIAAGSECGMPPRLLMIACGEFADISNGTDCSEFAGINAASF
jgi:hypothetical protein